MLAECQQKSKLCRKASKIKPWQVGVSTSVEIVSLKLRRYCENSFVWGFYLPAERDIQQGCLKFHCHYSFCRTVAFLVSTCCFPLYVLQNQKGSACRLNISSWSKCQAPKKSSKALFLVILQGVVDNTINPIMDCKEQKGWFYS